MKRTLIYFAFQRVDSSPAALRVPLDVLVASAPDSSSLRETRLWHRPLKNHRRRARTFRPSLNTPRRKIVGAEVKSDAGTSQKCPHCSGKRSGNGKNPHFYSSFPPALRLLHSFLLRSARVQLRIFLMHEISCCGFIGRARERAMDGGGGGREGGSA